MAKKKPAGPQPQRKEQIADDLQPLALPIESVKPSSSNARVHEDQSTRAIASSLKRYGQLKPIVYNVTSKEIVAGNGTYQAAVSLGWTHIAVVKVKQDKRTETGYALADNRTAELSEWNDMLLLEKVRELTSEEPQLFNDLDFDSILAGLPVVKTGVELKELHIQPPPAMTWVLIGVPTVRFGEISSQVEKLARVEGFVVESTSNNG